MNLGEERLKELDNPSLTNNERTMIRCAVAADLIHKGQYETARDALGELWPGMGERPCVKELPPVVAAEVLLQCGALTGLLGGARNVSGAQERAKDLLTEAVRKFRSQGEYQKASEAQCELGACYWRLGAYDEARVMMAEALRPLKDSDVELKARILIRRTLVEVWENRYHEALGILKEAEPVFESADDVLKGRWHGQKGVVLLKLAATEGRTEYADRATIEFTAASYHYEQARHERYCALNLNNLAFLLYKLGRYGDAHENLDRARLIFTRLEDSGNLARVDETRARVLVAEQRYQEAGRIVAGVVEAFDRSGELALLAGALTVQGVVWARLGSFESSINVLRQAMRVAQECGAPVNAGQAALTLIEEHGATRLHELELHKLYLRADALLKGTQDVEDVARLRACARVALTRLSGMRQRGKNFTLQGAVRDFEARFIEQALDDAGGSVTRAAELLGMKYQTLANLLKARHKRLQKKRTPPKKRKQSIVKKGA